MKTGVTKTKRDLSREAAIDFQIAYVKAVVLQSSNAHDAAIAARQCTSTPNHP